MSIWKIVESGAGHQSASDAAVCAVNEVNNLRNYFNMGAVMQKELRSMTAAIIVTQALLVVGRRAFVGRWMLVDWNGDCWENIYSKRALKNNFRIFGIHGRKCVNKLFGMGGWNFRPGYLRCSGIFVNGGNVPP